MREKTESKDIVLRQYVSLSVINTLNALQKKYLRIKIHHSLQLIQQVYFE